MSDSEHSDSSDASSEDLETTGLIATRAKRVTAGNLYATLRANLDDDELQKELLAEEEGDAGDYEGSDKDDDDEAMESSSDDEDGEGQHEDVEGEKAVKRQERQEARKKRKAQDARLKLPAWQKKNKRVKLADDVKSEDGITAEQQRKKQKKSERSNWLPADADAPLRQSGRSLAVANREIVHANLKESAARSEKQRRVMKHAAERDVTKKRMTEMSQEERLKKCERIERETAREFGRWEREEQERQEAREEALAAKRRRVVDGPVVRSWSGSIMWEGERIKVRRMSHGSRRVEEVETMNERPSHDVSGKASPPTASTTQTRSTPEPVPTPAQQSVQFYNTPTPHQNTPTQARVPWLHGIQEYAAQTNASPAPIPANCTPSAPSINNASTSQPLQPLSYAPPYTYHGWPPSTTSSTPQPTNTHPPPVPLLREQAQRTLLILSNFPSLEPPTTTTTKRNPKTPKPNPDTTLDTDALKTILLPHAHPNFTPEESRYLTTRSRKRLSEYPLPPPPAKLKCAVTSWTAKFRDPKTGLAYADSHQYKVIQRVLAGGCRWSGVLGCWVGPNYAGMGRAARGVPEGFTGGDVVGVGVKTEGL